MGDSELKTNAVEAQSETVLAQKCIMQVIVRKRRVTRLNKCVSRGCQLGL